MALGRGPLLTQILIKPTAPHCKILPIGSRKNIENMDVINKISVIICAYTERRWDELLAAIESVQHQTLPAEEIIVVIDRNPRLLARLQESVTGVIVRENNRAKGASGARNSAAAIAQGTILAFLDDDATAQPDWLEKLAAYYADQQVVGVGGRIEPRWSSKCPAWFPAEFNWVVGCSYQGMPVETASVRNVIGANMSVRKDAFMQSGGFRESFGNNKEEETSSVAPRSKWLHHHAGDEETEFCMRVTQHLPATRWLYVPWAVVQHYVPPQRECWQYFIWRCYDEGLGKAYLAQLHPASSALAAERAYTLRTLPRGVAHGLLAPFSRRDLTGFLRAGSIVVGLTMTVLGYLVGSVFAPARSNKQSQRPPVEHRHKAEIPHPLEV